MILKLFLLFVLSCLTLLAQSTTRQITLTWDDALNQAGTTYSVYRSTDPCKILAVFTQIASKLTAKTYTDTATPGQYCYYATATTNALESDRSNVVDSSVTPYPPSKLSVTVQLTVTVQ